MNDTIAAVATAAGESGIAIVRVSGPRSLEILKKAFRPKRKKAVFTPNTMVYGFVTDENGADIDEGYAVYFRAPYSYTAEDVIEIQTHGGRISAERTLRRVFALGAAPAGPGEFTRRAFENGRIDLTKAEAVMNVIGARSLSMHRAGIRQLRGGVTSFIHTASDALTGTLALIEACDDFPEEVEEDAASAKIASVIRPLIADLESKTDGKKVALVRNGARVALVGKPNVGKSSLLNALTGTDTAIVTAIPGTTRDVVTQEMTLDGIRVLLSDTAGQRETGDAVEKIGVERAKREAENADVVLIVLDSSRGTDAEDEALLTGADARAIIVSNKCDLNGNRSKEGIPVSAVTGAGLDALRAEIRKKIDTEAVGDDLITVQRQLELARSAAEKLKNALSTVEAGYPVDLAALDLQSALQDLLEITGENAAEGIIDRVFSDFCVGK